MGKFGGYPYPEIGPEEATKVIEVIKEQIGDTIEQTDREKLAKALGHQSADSGAFRQKLTALKRYNLLEGRGTLQTTELADRLVNGDDSVYREMLREVHLLNEAFDYFERRPVSHSYRKSWDDFVEDVLQESGEYPSKLKEYYEEFLGLLPDEERSKARKQDGSDEYLDKEREFKYYTERLDNENTRGAAITALNRQLSSKKIPDEEPLDYILEVLREERYPESQTEFFNLLRTVCENNDLDRFEEDKRSEVIDFLYGRLQEYTDEGNYRNRENSVNEILDTLEILYPDDLIDVWWDLLTSRLIEGANESNNSLRRFAYRDLTNRLVSGRDDIVNEFFETKVDKAEDDLWETMAATDNENLRDDCQRILGKIGVL
jgi:hypothetical protein